MALSGDAANDTTKLVWPTSRFSVASSARGSSKLMCLASDPVAKRLGPANGNTSKSEYPVCLVSTHLPVYKSHVLMVWSWDTEYATSASRASKATPSTCWVWPSSTSNGARRRKVASCTAIFRRFFSASSKYLSSSAWTLIAAICSWIVSHTATVLS